MRTPARYLCSACIMHGPGKWLFKCHALGVGNFEFACTVPHYIHIVYVATDSSDAATKVMNCCKHDLSDGHAHLARGSCRGLWGSAPAVVAPATRGVRILLFLLCSLPGICRKNNVCASIQRRRVYTQFDASSKTTLLPPLQPLSKLASTYTYIAIVAHDMQMPLAFRSLPPPNDASCCALEALLLGP